MKLRKILMIPAFDRIARLTYKFSEDVFHCFVKPADAPPPPVKPKVRPKAAKPPRKGRVRKKRRTWVQIQKECEERLDLATRTAKARQLEIYMLRGGDLTPEMLAEVDGPHDRQRQTRGRTRRGGDRIEEKVDEAAGALPGEPVVPGSTE